MLDCTIFNVTFQICVLLFILITGCTHTYIYRRMYSVYVNHPLLIEIDEYMYMFIYMDICVSVYMFMCTSLLYPVVSLGRKVTETQRTPQTFSTADGTFVVRCASVLTIYWAKCILGR